MIPRRHLAALLERLGVGGHPGDRGGHPRGQQRQVKFQMTRNFTPVPLLLCRVGGSGLGQVYLELHHDLIFELERAEEAAVRLDPEG